MLNTPLQICNVCNQLNISYSKPLIGTATFRQNALISCQCHLRELWMSETSELSLKPSTMGWQSLTLKPSIMCISSKALGSIQLQPCVCQVTLPSLIPFPFTGSLQTSCMKRWTNQCLCSGRLSVLWLRGVVGYKSIDYNLGLWWARLNVNLIYRHSRVYTHNFFTFYSMAIM